MANIKKGDLVQVITGPSQARGGDRGKQGKVIEILGEKNKILVEGINYVTKNLTEQFSYTNPHQVPGLVKIVVNTGVGEAARDSKVIDGAIKDLTLITGQKPQVNKARKSIAQYKLREGMPIGAHVTLRGDRAWEFLDRLLSLALPRIRDFRGLSPRQFDGHGNYTFGLSEQAVFHEINQDEIDRVRGFDITVVTTAKNDDEGRALLRELGFPFQATDPQ
jgi:large subunit ribosomal protein L5